MTRSTLSLALLLSLAGPLGPACAGDQTGPASQAEASGEGDQALSPELARGRDLIEDRCDDCHGVDLVYAESYNREGWIRSINTMVARGARLTEEERDTIIDYLLSR